MNHMSKKQKTILIRIFLSLFLLILAAVLEHFLAAKLPGFVIFLFYLLPYGVIGWDILRKAVLHIMHGQIFDENFLMSLATIGAFAVGEYKEASAVMLFYQVGELFQSYAVGKSRRSITGLMDIRPDTANIEQNGELICVPPEEVHLGEIIVIKPGEKVPLDGVIINGHTEVDNSALTGESRPVSLSAGDEILSGSVNGSGRIRVRVTRPFGQSTVAKILELVENSSAKKAVTENFITRFAKIYTPVVVCSAVLLAILPPIFLHAGGEVWKDWLKRAMSFLVISCPCALVISVPLSFFGGIGGASKRGILVKGGNYLEALSKTSTVVFDKTGTLTEGVFQVTKVESQICGEKELLRLAALAELYSEHPIARSIRQAFAEKLDSSLISEYKEIPGQGVLARIGEHTICVGSQKLLEVAGVKFTPSSEAGSLVYVAVDKEYAGYILISDKLRPQSLEAIKQLKNMGIQHSVMLTGDKEKIAKEISSRLGLDAFYAELLPQDKAKITEELLGKMEKNENLAFVGDGINDAPALSIADIGIAMGAIGSDAAIEAADVVLMDDNPVKIAEAIHLSKKTMRIVWQNIVFSLAVKVIILLLSAFGYASMWLAVFADVGVAMLAILNAMRTLQTEKNAKY